MTATTKKSPSEVLEGLKPKTNGQNGQTASTVIHVPAPSISTISLELIGLTPLIQHRWSEKARREMREKQMGAARAKKAPKSPEQDFLESMYVVPGREDWPVEKEGRYYAPLLAIKNAAVDACSLLPKDVTKVLARAAFFIKAPPEFASGAKEAGPILHFSSVEMREDLVRVGMGTADLRYRGQFNDWSCTVEIDFNQDVMTPDTLVHLFKLAGFSIGIGEWRPQRDGQYGRFDVEGVQ